MAGLYLSLRTRISILVFIFVAGLFPLPSLAQDFSTSLSQIPPAAAEDLKEVVVPITSLQLRHSVGLNFSGSLSPKLGIGAGFGTGFCLDSACRYVATNYHVAVMTAARKIKSQKIAQRYLATGPHDEGATPNFIPEVGVLPYAKKRDLAIFELRHSLPRHHGRTLSLEELHPGQAVDIYGYPKGRVNPVRALIRFPATFKAPTTSGLLAFEYEERGNKPVQIRGASGGIVVDRASGHVVGILCETTDTLALAVSVQTLAQFVTKVQPFLAEQLFPSVIAVSPVLPDLYPGFAPPADFYRQLQRVTADGLEHPPGELQHRPAEPPEVSLLRKKAQSLADSVRDFIAVQSFAWGSGDKEPAASDAYEVRMIGGAQEFRRYPEGAKEFREIPHPSLGGWVLGSDEWSHLPKMVGTEYRLKVRQAPDAMLGDRLVKVFQYRSSVEDNLCPFAPVEDFGLFSISKTVSVACYGEVWTDEETNILRISLHLDLSQHAKAYRGWEAYRIVVTYGWLERANETPRLIPRTIFAEARDKKRSYWCRGQFTNYQVFDVQAKFLPNSN